MQTLFLKSKPAPLLLAESRGQYTHLRFYVAPNDLGLFLHVDLSSFLEEQ